MENNIIRVKTENAASECDKLLTKLIQDERKYDSFINNNFIVKDYFKNVIKDENNILLVYQENEIIKGYIYLKYIEIDGNQGYLIDGLYVLENYRNCGISKMLIDEALKILANKNIKFIDINVMYQNELAKNLYKHFGFKDFKITMRKIV